MPSVSDICNLALSFVGKPEITSLEENTAPAKWCRRAYDPARREVLARSDWVSARAYARLIQTIAPSHPEYGHTYALPGDLVKVRALGLGVSPYRRNAAWTPVQHELHGNHILAAEPGATLWYTRDLVDPNQWGEGMAQAVAYKLAAMIAPQATGRPADAQALAGLYEGALLLAIEIDASQEKATWYRGEDRRFTPDAEPWPPELPYDSSTFWGSGS